ncbi:MAG TPA: hypothetical protein VE263_21410 [Candidatus Angelobacter sp.]|nr:hypothetical protein [Candidatus Angelobacter sp.]
MTFPSDAPGKLVTASSYRYWSFALAVSAGIALLIVSPFFWRGNASGHDIAFHASSWLDAAGQWKEGILYPRWAEWANYGFGEPRFIFYPPLSWMLGAALSLLLPGNVVPGAFIVLTQTLAGLSMFGLAQRRFSLSVSIFSAACYAANPYALLIIYMRSDFAELLACAFLPALLLAGLSLCGLIENRWRSLGSATGIFALLLATVWLCNAPAGVLTTYSMALLFAWGAIREKSFRPLLLGAGGLALGFGLACFYLIPAAYEQRWVNIVQALASGLQPSQNFLFTQINDPEHNLFNWIASSIAILLIVLAGFAALLGRRSLRGEDCSSERKEFWQALLLLGAASTMLMVRPSSFLWEHLPKLRFVQFPWRWMGILAVPYAYLGAAVVARRRAAWIWAAVVTVAVAGTGVFLVQRAWWDSDDVPSLQDAIANGQGFEGTDEYDPGEDDHYNLPKNAPRFQVLPADGTPEITPKADVHMERWTAEDKELHVDSPKPSRLAVRLLDYPAWRVEINGQAIKPEFAEETAQMILPLGAGSQRISITFARTPDRKIGALLSGVSVLALAGAFWGAGSGSKTGSRSL